MAACLTLVYWNIRVNLSAHWFDNQVYNVPEKSPKCPRNIQTDPVQKLTL